MARAAPAAASRSNASTMRRARPVGLLGSADRALAGNYTGTANELLERAAVM